MDSQRTEQQRMDEQAARLARLFDALNGDDPDPLAPPSPAAVQDRAARAAQDEREIEERARRVWRVFGRLNGNDGDTPPPGHPPVPQPLAFLPVDKRGQRV